MHFQKLRLAGFKSFVEPTELLIEPGLTGIVGPNGCGKSNLVEALRWVMGETSAKQMRGGEMDDVIFGGTASRPSRNIAEVGLHLDNADRRAPAAFNKHDELEITRRIERSHGSTYRVNGREVRARDVQLLFADASSGARSTAIVSQGQIGAFIAARPEQRRAVIEEAAGITGLHSRRHEAELRLRGAETNLERLDDVVVTLEAQLQTLKKQARQANRYRRLSEHLRTAEALLFQARWREAGAALATAKRSLAAAEEAVNVTARAVASASAAQAEAARAVPTAREAEGRAAGALQKLVAEREAIDAEERREREALRAAETRLAEVRRDTEREQSRLADAEAALRRLAEEGTALSADGRDEEADRREARERLDAVEAEVASLEARSRKAADELAAAEAERNALMRQVREAEERLGRVRRQQELVAKDHAAARAAAVDPALVQAAEAAVAAAEAALAEAGDAADKAAEDLPQAREAEAAARDALQSASASLTALQAEERALAKVLTSATPGRWRPLIDEVQVESGYEAALGAGLGDDLGAAVTEDAPIHWRNLPPLEGTEPLPEGTAPLSAYVEAPDLLGRRLAQIGVVEDERQGEDLAAQLRPGQRLVSIGGMLWRWDGYVRAAGAETPTAKLLAQRNQLRAIRKRLPPAEAAEAEAKAALEKACAVTAEASRREKESRDAARAAQAALEQRRREHAQLAQKATVQESRLVSIEETLERLAAEIADHEGQTSALRERVAALGEPAAARDAVEGLRRALAAKREAFAEARSHRDRIERDIETRRKRVEAIAQETTSWQERAGEAGGHLEALAERAAVEEEALTRLRERPGENAERRRLVLERIEEAEARRRIAADELAQAERRLVERDGALKSAERALAEAREERVRREAAVAQATHDCETWIERTQERLHQHPETLGAVTGVADDAELPEVGALEDRLQRLQRERESLGGVNLRAEEEVEAITAQIDTIHAEREDVLAAIAKLRRGIADLNREARERLLVAFDKVNAHFKDLFVRLFGGGQAHLALTEADDPLDAGLEIMASPPGKKMQSLTLLSGGERALTALSLLFAVFLTNPAPVCVLDEVDAPLDDANVDRFCTLLDEIAEAASTRFLIVTHHRLTMARMDRLYGVTMAERGISQLVSVDLRVAEDLRATA